MDTTNQQATYNCNVYGQSAYGTCGVTSATIQPGVGAPNTGSDQINVVESVWVPVVLGVVILASGIIMFVRQFATKKSKN